MINKLTKEQENKLKEYRDKWLKIGLSTERINRPDAISRWHEFDKVILGFDLISTASSKKPYEVNFEEAVEIKSNPNKYIIRSAAIS